MGEGEGVINEKEEQRDKREETGRARAIDLGKLL